MTFTTPGLLRPLSFGLFTLILATSQTVLAQRAGQSISVDYGIVKAGAEVDLKSGAVPAGAVVGGTLGLLSAKGKSSSKKTRNAIIGSVAGGAVASAAQGNTRGMVYTVDMVSGGAMQVVTDQREIRSGDCVAVERAGETANLRRVSSQYCKPENRDAVASVSKEANEEAGECLAAKQQLVEASTEEALNLAKIKIDLLCAD